MKVSLKVKVESADNCIKLNTKGILNEKTNILTYSEEKNTKVRLNFDKNELIRENEEIIMNLCFVPGKKTSAKIYMKEMHQEIFLELKTIEIVKKSSFYKVIYQIEGTHINEYSLELEK